MSGEIAPRIFRWDAEKSVMAPVHPRQADRQYVDGEEYRLGIVEERSTNSHKHYFAAINEAWKNLREEDAARFHTPEHLRKYALIRAGYADVMELVASTRAEALRFADYVRKLDEYAVVTVRDKTVQRFTAKSPSVRAMGKAEFEDSKRKVLEIVSAMIEVEPRTLAENIGKAA